MSNLQWLNPAIIGIYMLLLLAVGVYFSRKQTSTEAYFVASRSVPGWAMGISLLATIITSVTFIAYPGASYAGNWSLIIPGTMMLIVPLAAGPFIVPFFRHVVRMSAFEYFGRRFGRRVRLYSSAMFALGHLAKMAFVLYLLALTVNSITGWRVEYVLLSAVAITVVYAFIGGLEAIIWADVIQGILLWVGVFVAIGLLLHLTPASPSQIFHEAWRAHKFSLGDTSMSLRRPGLLVLVLYGLFFYIQKYTADQTVVQRYLAARTDKQALRGILLGALLCIPVWSLFMLVGTLLWAFYKFSGEALPPFITKGDQVFPHFLATHFPPGMAGVFLATLFGAGIAMLASDLNCLATITVEDFYKNWRPQATEKSSLRLGKAAVVVSGIAALSIAWLLAHSHGTALSLYYAASSIVAGGLAGIFLLAFLSKRANKAGVQVGIVFNIVFTVWATLTAGVSPLWAGAKFRFMWQDYMIGVVGQFVMLVVGYIASLLLQGIAAKREEDRSEAVTLWKWLAQRNIAGAMQGPSNAAQENIFYKVAATSDFNKPESENP
jgi:SSS family solute:Na+ symporter